MAIKVESLRLGNWVSNGDFNYKVDCGSLYDAATLEYYPLEGIPITPDILRNIGVIKEGIELRLDQGLCYVDFKGNTLTAAMYVHELQNLFYALTNTEIEYKP